MTNSMKIGKEGIVLDKIDEKRTKISLQNFKVFISNLTKYDPLQDRFFSQAWLICSHFNS